MMETKECFGHCGYMHVRYRDLTAQYYLHVDQEKLKECDACPLFLRCMFIKHNDVFRETLKLVNDLADGRNTRI